MDDPLSAPNLRAAQHAMLDALHSFQVAQIDLARALERLARHGSRFGSEVAWVVRTTGTMTGALPPELSGQPDAANQPMRRSAAAQPAA